MYLILPIKEFVPNNNKVYESLCMVAIFGLQMRKVNYMKKLGDKFKTCNDKNIVAFITKIDTNLN